MIMIWDNGEEYSGHEIRFLDLPEMPKLGTQDLDLKLRLVEKLLRRRADRSCILGVVDSVAWWKGGASPLGDLLLPSYLFAWRKKIETGGVSADNVKPRETAWTLGRTFVRGLVEQWKNWSGSYDPDCVNVGVPISRQSFIAAAEKWANREE